MQPDTDETADESNIAARHTKVAAIMVGAIIAVALVLRLWGCDFGLPRIFHPDETKLVQPALELLNINRPNLHPGHLVYPAGYMYVLAVSYSVYGVILLVSGAVAGAGDLAEFLYLNSHYLHLVGRVTTAVFGALTVWMAYRAVSELFDRRAGIASAAFLAVAYAHIIHSHYATSDVPTAFVAMACIYFSARLYNTGERKYLLLAGLFAGLTGGFKYPAIVVVCAPLAAHVVGVIQDERPLKETVNRDFWAVLGLAVGGFLIINPYVILDWPLFIWDLLKLKFVIDDPALEPYLGSTGAFDYFFRFKPSLGLGWPMVGCLLVGLVSIPLRWRGRAAILLAFPVVYYVVVAYPSLHIMRYLLLALPVFCCIAGVGLVSLVDLVIGSRYRLAVVGIITAAITFPSLVNAVRWDLAASNPNPPREQASKWIRKNVEPGAVFLKRASSSGLRYHPAALGDKRYRVRALTFEQVPWQHKRIRFLANLTESPLFGGVAEGVLARGMAVEESRKRIGYAGVLTARTMKESRRSIRPETVLEGLPDHQKVEPDQDLPPLEYYLGDGPTYAIIGGLERGYLRRPVTKGWERTVGQMRTYYDRIRSEWELLARFQPAPHRRVPYFIAGDFVGNYSVEIYRAK